MQSHVNVHEMERLIDISTKTKCKIEALNSFQHQHACLLQKWQHVQGEKITRHTHTQPHGRVLHSEQWQRQRQHYDPKLLKTGKFNLQMIVLKWIFASSCCCSSHVQVHCTNTPNNHQQVYVEHDMALQIENAALCISVWSEPSEANAGSAISYVCGSEMVVLHYCICSMFACISWAVCAHGFRNLSLRFCFRRCFEYWARVYAFQFVQTPFVVFFFLLFVCFFFCIKTDKWNKSMRTCRWGHFKRVSTKLLNHSF